MRISGFYYIIYFCLILLVLTSGFSYSTHLMGGEITYRHLSQNNFGSTYQVKLIVYRYCDTTSGFIAPLDSIVQLGIFTNQTASPAYLLYWNSTIIIPLQNSYIVASPPGNSACQFQSTSCIERGEYIIDIFLPSNQTGYHLLMERCCRNGNIVNLLDPQATGMTFYTKIPAGLINSSPQFPDISAPYICAYDTTSIINNAIDPDGDSLVYSFATPYRGTSGGNVGSAPDPMDLSPYSTPIPLVTYNTGYSLQFPFGTNGYSNINPLNGLTKYYIPAQGMYVVSIEIREFRNGNLIGITRRDMQFITIICPSNDAPTINTTAFVNVYTVNENQQLCFNVNSIDLNGDSIYLIADGPLLNPALTFPAGVISDTSGIGFTTSEFCWTPVCGMSRSLPYIFTITAIDNGCPPKSNSQIFSVYVEDGLPVIPPELTVYPGGTGIICQGAPVELYASLNVPGSNPSYSWYVNGNLVQTGNDSILISSTLSNGDSVSVIATSNASCLTTNTVTSNTLVINHNGPPIPTVTITSFPQTLCPMQNCIYTASVTNGGNNPSYQWVLNNTPAGSNIDNFTAATNGGTLSVYVIVTPSTGCPPQTSNVITVVVGPMLSPTINIVASADSVCQGTPVTFTANSLNTGSPPVYSWYLNNNNIGGTGSSLTLNNLNDGDQVYATVTSNYSCLIPSIATSDIISIHVYPDISVDITDGPIQLCEGSEIELNSSVSGGITPSMTYIWSANNSGTSNNIFTPTISNYYTLNVINSCNNIATDSVFIEVMPVPIADFEWVPYTPTIYQPDVQFINTSFGSVHWLWSFGDSSYSVLQNPNHIFNSAGNFEVELIATNIYDCKDSLTKLIYIDEDLVIYIPNAFTPNGDGINDSFGVTVFPEWLVNVKIFNRWGQMIFSSSNAADKWNGKNKKGNDSPTGLYNYFIELKKADQKRNYSGNVFLIR